jgi:hypothetical protein
VKEERTQRAHRALQKRGIPESVNNWLGSLDLASVSALNNHHKTTSYGHTVIKCRVSMVMMSATVKIQINTWLVLGLSLISSKQMNVLHISQMNVVVSYIGEHCLRFTVPGLVSLLFLAP